ncbi:MAG: response regulator [Deltaproteobacteria bacterium]|nr:MAG: response regulator [Deltaproteobacteria bacterium]
MRILVVDPDPTAREELCGILATMSPPPEIDEAETCKAALAALGRGVDLVVLEPLLPDASGLDVLRAAVARDPQIPVLVVSDLDRDIDRFWALRQGAHAFVTKPVERDVLLDRVARALEGAPRLTPERV